MFTCPVCQVDAAWDAAVAALKAVLEPAFQGATAAAAMLTVKDFVLLTCLALGGWGRGERVQGARGGAAGVQAADGPAACARRLPGSACHALLAMTGPPTAQRAAKIANLPHVLHSTLLLF